MAKVLIVDDEKDIRFLISEVLADEGHSVVEAAHSDAALAALKKETFDLLILDIWLENSDLDGMELLAKVKKDTPNQQVLMVSGHGTVEMAVKAIQQGAFDFLEKPFGSDRLIMQVNRALQAGQLVVENKTLRQQTATGGAWVGKSAASAQVAKALEKLSASETRVLVTGEMGVGKSLIIRLLANGQNVTAWSDTLAELAENGVVLVENIESLQPEQQQILLKQLTASGKRARVLSTACAEIDTVTSLRKDLYERLAVARIDVPPLRSRPEDMADLCANLQPNLPLTPDVLAMLKAYSWPGNARELRLVLELAALRGGLNAADLALPAGDAPRMAMPILSNDNQFSLPVDLDLRAAREQFERAYLSAQMARFDGNVTAVAKHVDMDRAAMHRKLKSLET